MTACAHAGAVDVALQLHHLSAARGDAAGASPPGEGRVGALISALCDDGRVAEAAAMYEEYSARGLRLRGMPRRRLMRACEKQLSPAGGADMERVVRELWATRTFGEGSGTDVAMIRSLGARGYLDEAIELYHTAAAAALPHAPLGRGGVSEQLQLLNAVLLACARCGDAAAALDLLRRGLDSHPAAVDAVSVNTALIACERSGDAASLAPAFDAMVEGARHGAADARGVATLLTGCERGADARLALRVYDWAERSGLTGA